MRSLVGKFGWMIGVGLFPLAFPLASALACEPRDPKIDAWQEEFREALKIMEPSKEIGDVPRLNLENLGARLPEAVGIPREIFAEWKKNFNAKPPSGALTIENEGRLLDSTQSAYMNALGAYTSASGRCRAKRSKSVKWMDAFFRKFGKREISEHRSAIGSYLFEYSRDKEDECSRNEKNDLYAREEDFKVTATAYYQSLLDHLRGTSPEKRRSLDKGIRYLEGYILTIRQASFRCVLDGDRLRRLRGISMAVDLPKEMRAALRTQVNRGGGIDPAPALKELSRRTGGVYSSDPEPSFTPTPRKTPDLGRTI